MKKLFPLLILLISVFSHSVSADTADSRRDSLLRFIATQDIFRNKTLASVISTRCSRYLPSNEAQSCNKAVVKMIQIMDYDVIFPEDKAAKDFLIPSSFVFVAFKQKFISNLSQAKTKIYLDALNQKLYDYMLDDSVSVNIWELTKKHFPGDFAASMIMATLFQDTSSTKLHLAYLEQAKVQGNLEFEENKELLSRVIDTINMVLDRPGEDFGKLFYPTDLAANFNRNLYHFYVPLYLTKALMLEGIKPDAAFASTMMLNMTYEFITSASDFRFLLTDPATIQSQNTLQDIYEGYCGSALGAYKDKFSRNFENVRTGFKRSTRAGVSLLLKH